MVGLVKPSPREKIATLIKSAKSSTDAETKLKPLRKLKADWFQNDPVLVSEFLPCLFELQPDHLSVVRQFITLLIGDIGLKHLDFMPEIVPMLISAVEDTTPAVTRQALNCGIGLFKCILQKVAIQGLFSSDMDDSLESAWTWMLKFNEKICTIAFQAGSDSTRLLALKFVEVIILLYTPDPNGSPDPPTEQVFEGNTVDFNMAWFRGGHPLLNAGDLATEAGQNLGMLLDLVRLPAVKSLTISTIIVSIKILAAIAVKRPAFYGRILPVLLALDLSGTSTTIRGFHVAAANHALKTAYLSCLNCTHPGAAPWRDRLHGALREIKSEKGAERQLLQASTDKDCSDNKMTDLFGKEEKPLIQECDATNNSSGKKRRGAEDSGNREKEVTAKHVKLAPPGSEDLVRDEKMEVTPPMVESTSSERDADTGPAHQLIAMFGALVAQGEKAVASLDILISSISSDLMADVVMVNMQNLPHISPKNEGDEELHQIDDLTGTSYKRKHPSSLAAEISELANGIPQIASLLDVKQPSHIEDEKQDAPALDDSVVALAETARENDFESPVGLPTSVGPEKMEGIESPVDPERFHSPKSENEIPGLEFEGIAPGIPLSVVNSSSMVPLYSNNVSQELATSIDGNSMSNLVQSVSIDRSEELSPQLATTDVNSLISSTATSARFPNQVALPKLSAPVVELNDAQKDALQQCTYKRIVEVYKEMVTAGGIDVRFSLLAYLGVEFPSELDPWRALREHILSDYSNHGGHELTLRVLYRLFGEAEVEHDFFSSKTATSDYEVFLETVVETLRDDFPATDKSYSKLLSEVPYIPKSVFNTLECLCCPGKDEKESYSVDRVKQGLSTVWSLIRSRPPIRDACLNIALQSAVHQMGDVRANAIRLVANKLYPLSYISQQIEEFAKKSLLSVVSDTENADTSTDVLKDSESEKVSDVHPSTSHVARGTQQLNASEGTSSSSTSEPRQSMELYFALCTKKHSLLRELFVIYRVMPKLAKKDVDCHIPQLVRTIGASAELLEIISYPPMGSGDLLLQVLHTLTDSAIPSPELIASVKIAYASKLQNVEILIPCLPYLPKEEVRRIFSRIVDLPMDKFQTTLSVLIQGSSPAGPLMDPSEVLIAIHGIDPDTDGIPLKRVTDACNVCFQMKQIFTQQVIAKVLNQLVEKIPLPMLFLRTVLQTIGAFPDLGEFVIEILSRLVSKQIWKNPKLWLGFLKCASVKAPQSFSVLLQLPPAPLESALNKISAMRESLIAFASQPNIKSTLPRSVLVVLGLAPPLEPSTLRQTLISQPQPEPQAEADIQVRSPTEATSEQQAQSPTQTESHSQTESQQPQTESEPQQETQTQSASQTDTLAETDAQSQSQSGSQADTQTDRQAQSGSKSPQAETEAEMQNQSHSDSQTESQTEAQTQALSHSQSGSEAQTRTENQEDTMDTNNREHE